MAVDNPLKIRMIFFLERKLVGEASRPRWNNRDLEIPPTMFGGGIKGLQKVSQNFLEKRGAEPLFRAPVAQLDRATGFEPVGWVFDSPQAQ